jgi:hypothetical protein
MSSLPNENLAPLYVKFGNILSALEKIGKDYMFLFAVGGIFIGLMFLLASTVDWLKFGNWTEHSLYANGWIFETNSIGYGRLVNGFLSLHPIITIPIIGVFAIYLLRVTLTMLAVFIFSITVSFIKLFKIKIKQKLSSPSDQSPTPDL